MIDVRDIKCEKCLVSHSKKDNRKKDSSGFWKMLSPVYDTYNYSPISGLARLIRMNEKFK